MGDRPKKILIATVGTGGRNNPVWEALIYSVEYHNPDIVHWLCSRKTVTETLPKVRDNLKIPRNSQFAHIAKDEDNIESLYLEYIRVFDDIRRKLPAADIIADFTSGTKAMSAALSLAAISRAEPNDRLAYMIGQRDESGRATRTDKAISFSPEDIYAERQLSQAIEYFNECDYPAAHRLAKQIKEQLSSKSDSPLKLKAQTIAGLAIAYNNWDLFLYKQALHDLRKFAKQIYLAADTIEKLQPQLDFLAKCAERNSQWADQRIVDLFANAKRCFTKGRYDDAVARCYRLLEYIAQRELQQKHGIDTGNIDYSKLSNQTIETVFRSNNKKKCGLVEAYRLLAIEFKHPIGISFEKEYKGEGNWKEPKGTLAKILNKRNNSLLAHGFSPIDKDSAKTALCTIEIWLKQHIEQFDNLINAATFSKLNQSSFAGIVQHNGL